MDIRMRTIERSSNVPLWDFEMDLDPRSESYGSLKTYDGEPEIKQRAIIAGFLQRGTVPELPDVGNPIAELLTEAEDLNVFQSTVQENIKNLANTIAYKPNFTTEDGKLVMTIGE